MALQITITNDTGTTYENAYARITSGRFSKTEIMVMIDVHKDQAAREGGLRPVANFILTFPLENGATFDSLYAAIKTDSNFAGAVDLL